MKVGMHNWEVAWEDSNISKLECSRNVEGEEIRKASI
jgi:hypothetical protein